jgi:DNA-binding XRE family transcriptional regulator
MNMSTSSLILYRTFQVLGFILAIFKIFAPFIALYLLWRIARNLEKPPKLTEEVKIVRKSLSEMLKENRTRCKMTQEFVAESIGVSRQAVSKWENGTSEPNTSNLMALAKLYGIPAEDLLKGVESALEAQEKES